jgi:hypothetical protein
MGHNQPGATSFGNFIYFAGESTLDGFYQFFTLQNPNAVASPTTIRYFTNTGQVIDRSVTLPPNSRTTVQVFNAQEVGKGALGQVFEGIATKIISAQPILVERPFYIAGRDVLGLTIDDGTDVLGTLADF